MSDSIYASFRFGVAISATDVCEFRDKIDPDECASECFYMWLKDNKLKSNIELCRVGSVWDEEEYADVFILCRETKLIDQYELAPLKDLNLKVNPEWIQEIWEVMDLLGWKRQDPEWFVNGYEG